MLDYLVFDHSEGEDGTDSWDALAAPRAPHSARLMHETSALLQALLERWGPPGPLDEGHAWDFDLQVHDPQDQPWPWSWSAQGLQWQRRPQEDCPLRLALSLCAVQSLRLEVERLLTGPGTDEVSA